jgi:hypothetical protein
MALNFQSHYYITTGYQFCQVDCCSLKSIKQYKLSLHNTPYCAVHRYYDAIEN